MQCLGFLLALTAFVCPVALARSGRTVILRETDVAEIKTVIGYSTLLQFDSRPTSVVAGDQDAFKVEYVGQGLSIKPLLPNISTNLFIFTDYDRFSFRVSSSRTGVPDYYVRVRRRPQPGAAATPEF